MRDTSIFDFKDPFLLDKQLTDEERLIRDSAHDYAQGSLQPRIAAAYLNETSDPKMFAELGEMGLGVVVEAPLRGLKVLELARILADPWIGQTFADLGADVVKVEAPLDNNRCESAIRPFVVGRNYPRSIIMEDRHRQRWFGRIEGRCRGPVNPEPIGTDPNVVEISGSLPT
ncbi:MAG TPA: CoA transferase, partial [Steroidobacteraceae bacterium]|nr:CoA transferase [Steroidobacteraceae bacterium]